MAKNNRKCLLCKDGYHYCPTCKDSKDAPKYLINFDSQNCKDIFDVLVKNSLGEMSDEDAKKAIGKLDISKKENYDKGTKKQIERILAAGASDIKKNKKFENKSLVEPREESEA